MPAARRRRTWSDRAAPGPRGWGGSPVRFWIQPGPGVGGCSGSKMDSAWPSGVGGVACSKSYPPGAAPEAHRCPPGQGHGALVQKSPSMTWSADSAPGYAICSTCQNAPNGPRRRFPATWRCKCLRPPETPAIDRLVQPGHIATGSARPLPPPACRLLWTPGVGGVARSILDSALALPTSIALANFAEAKITCCLTCQTDRRIQALRCR